MRRLDSNGSISAFSSSVRGDQTHVLPAVGESEAGGAGDHQSDSGRTVTSTFAAAIGGDRHRSAEESEKVRRILVESLWKSVLEPALEYSFVSKPPLDPVLRTVTDDSRLNRILFMHF